MEDLGYETHNSVLNLGSIGLFLALYSVQLFVFLLILLPFFRERKITKSAKGKLMFSELLQTSFECYMELMIAGYLNFRAPGTTSGEIVGLGLGYFALFLTFLFLPAVSLFIFSRSIP